MTRDEAIYYLTHDPDTGEATDYLTVPASRWGRTTLECAITAYELDSILAEESGEPMTEQTLDFAMGLVVNDHDDVGTILNP